MSNAIDLIIPPAKTIMAYGQTLLKGVLPEHFARKPKPGGVLIDCNHPAFVFGHLSIYPARMGKILAIDTSDLEASAHFVEVFKRDTACQDDEDGTIYPPMNTIVEQYEKAYQGLLAKLPSVDPKKFFEPHPEENQRARFPLIGNSVNFLLTAHIAMHLGQVSTWRRCMGLGSAM